MTKNVAIIGSGIAGLSLAHELSCMGISSTLIDRFPLPGGNAARYSCKATDSCQRCGACTVQDYVSKISGNEKIELLMNSEALEFRHTSNGFELQLLQSPQYVDPEKCSGCGICKKVCPSTNAILVDPFTGKFFVNYPDCSRSQNMACMSCEQACPESAIDLSPEPGLKILETGAVALATGFEPFDPTVKTRFGYGRIPGVISAIDLEDKLRRGYFDLLDETQKPAAIAFIQCVGSRDTKIGRNYCSRVCCGYALRSARLLKFKFPQIRISMFYMDLQTFDRNFEDRLAAASKEVNLVRAIPSEIRMGPSEKPMAIYNGLNDEVVVEEYDWVVLSVGMGPDQRPIKGLAHSVSADFDYGSSRFLQALSTVDGAFVTGAALGPKSIQESIDNSIHIALKIDSYLDSSQSGVDLE